MEPENNKQLRRNEVELSGKQHNFCLEYMKDFNAKAAAIRAGYTAKTASQASNLLLQNPLVKQRIVELRDLIVVNVFDEVHKVIKKFEEIRELSMGNLPLRDRDGQLMFEANLPAAVAANKELAKIYGAYEKDNQQKSQGLPAPVINIINTAPKRAEREEDIED
jgi:hypothetical protein